jgi:hypothetical protein
MSKVEELKAEIEKLPGEDFAELYRWLAEKDWGCWDQEIEADSKAGLLTSWCARPKKKRPRGL